MTMGHRKKHEELFLNRKVQNVLYTSSKCTINSKNLLETLNLHNANSQKFPNKLFEHFFQATITTYETMATYVFKGIS